MRVGEEGEVSVVCGSRSGGCFRLDLRDLRMSVWDPVRVGPLEAGRLVEGCCFCSSFQSWALRLDRWMFSSVRVI